MVKVFFFLSFLQVSAQNEDLIATTKQWFGGQGRGGLCPRGIQGIQQMASTQPFLELRLAGLRLLKAIANLNWGQQYFLQQPGFFEYLLDRSTERDNDGKRAKYAVVETLVKSPTTASVLGNELMVKLRAYHLEGPFFVQVESSVAYEGD